MEWFHTFIYNPFSLKRSGGWQGDISGHNKQREAYNSNSKIKSIKSTEDFPEYYLQKSPCFGSNFY